MQPHWCPTQGLGLSLILSPRLGNSSLVLKVLATW